MILKELKPRKALNKAFLKVKPNRIEIEGFKTNLITLLDRTNEKEREEFHKNLVSDFLKKTYYDPNHFINTKASNDMVIHNGKEANSSVGVIIEAKKPTNKAEMVSPKKLNVKAFQELVLYYLRERITQKNLEIKHLIATNINEWFIFDSSVFDRLFAQNKQFVKQYEDFTAKRLADDTTDFFYKQIAEPFIENITSEIEFTYFNIQDFQTSLRNTDKSDDNSLIALFKLLSPEHLLKLPFTNDSNSLEKRFYSELLHIIGLSETKDGGKKLIQRSKDGERNTGTILEDAIIQLDSLDKLNRLEKPSQYGNTQQERLFNVALELSITWVNRILFLKLLEAQLISYHKLERDGSKKLDKSFSFLNLEKIKNYDDLNSLFFQVLAKKYEERNEDVKKAFEKVPYLNSSLFEPTDMEQVTLFISNLKDEKTIPIFNQTVLKDQQGKKKAGQLSTLQYLFEFLDAYDFGAEGSEKIQEDNKTLINASVLGLIFEKINGYKDGSFFTPGFITMYMCRETIRKAVLQKFNESKGWNCEAFDELYDKIEDRNEANQIVNSIKICDPAVGSGHFLVSALNEIIAVKSELKILQDRNNKRLKEYQVEVVNDELIVVDDEGELFEYHPNNKESQRVQEALFHEKQTIIENCLFGVDINSNSVKICRLRLWIELLKNAYYKTPTELETLPNIDINIKCGNSLVSRFAIDADMKQALKKSKWSIDSYKLAVDTYRNAESKEQKREMERLIADIKSDFRSEISSKDPKVTKHKRLSGELYNLTNQQMLFDLSKKEKAEWNKKVEKLSSEVKRLEQEIEEIKSNKIFENAFEWRFEFPEVLNDDGDFVGFDVVIGNPPYQSSKDFSKLFIKYYSESYVTSQYQLDLYVIFMELSVKILKTNFFVSFITPNSWLKNMMFTMCRKFLISNVSFNCFFPNLSNVFEEASVDSLIFIGSKSDTQGEIDIMEFLNQIPSKRHVVFQNRFANNDRFIFDVESNDFIHAILLKLKSKSRKLEDLCDITRGVNPYDKYTGQSEITIKERLYHANYKKDETFLPEIRGKHVSHYNYCWDGKNFISYGNWLAAPREMKFFKGSRIILRQVLGTRLNCTRIDEDMIIDQSVFIAKPNKENENLINAIQAVLGSKLMTFYFRYSSNEFDALFPKIKIGEFKELPVPLKIKEFNSRVENYVEQVFHSKKQNDIMKVEENINKIDQIIYEIYELTEEEISLVEKS